MNWIVGVSTVLLTIGSSFSQSFSTASGSSSFTSGGSVCKNITVTGISSVLNHDLGLKSVTLNITHPDMSQIDVSLKAPDGTTFSLVVGGYGSYTGANFTNTVLTQVNSPGDLDNGTAPFTGYFRPNDFDFDFCNVNNNVRTGNGTWQVCVTSAYLGGAGIFVNATLTFGTNAPSEYGTGVAGESPALATYKCNLTNYSGWTSKCYDNLDVTGTNLSSVSVVPFSIDNDSWFKIQPTGSILTISFTVQNCSLSYGAQLVVLRPLNSGLTSFEQVPTSSGTNPYTAGTHTETIVGLIPGEPIYIMFDGYANDVCEYLISSFTYSGASPLLIQAEPKAYCAGSGISSQITTEDITSATYIWTPSTGLSSTSVFNPVASPTSTTMYKVTATDAVSGCVFKDSITITVNPLPLTNAGNDVAICSGASIPLTMSAAGLTTTGVEQYFNANDVTITDNNTTGVTSTITVSGVNPTTYSSSVIDKVCLNIDHPDVSELEVKLTAPNGSTIWLHNMEGQGPDFIGACFVPSGGSTIGYSTQAPLWSNYAPYSSFTGITSGSAVNGTWTLTVIDNATGNVGTLQDWTILFNDQVTYTWSPSTNLSSTATASTSANPTSTTTYTATIKDGNGCTATDNVIVTVNPSPTISGTLTVCVGSTTQLTGSGTPDATTPWASSNSTVATVSSAGLVTGIAAGTAVITYKDNSGCSKTATVTVYALPTITGTLTACSGGTTQLTGSATANATTPWTSSNTAVATVSNTGLVTGVSAGTTTITYMNTNGCTKTTTVTISAPAITGTLTLCKSGTTQLTGSGTPATLLPWSSSNTSVATVNSSGLVSGWAAGTSTITYKDNNGCTTTVIVTVNAATITGSSSVCIGSTTQLTGSGTPAVSNAWVSSNNAAVTVSSTGL